MMRDDIERLEAVLAHIGGERKGGQVKLTLYQNRSDLT